MHKNLFSVSMESLSPQVVSAAKLPILNPNEFELWKMRIEQNFRMTDYSLWEVILNGDSPAPTRVSEGVVQHVAPTTVEQRLAKKNKLKARAIEKRFGGNKETRKRNKTDLEEQSLDDLVNSLKIYEAEVKSSSFASTSTQNIAFVSSQTTDSTNEPVSAVASVSATSAKIPIFSLPNVDTLRKGTLQESVGHLRTQEGMFHYDWSFRQKKNQPTMPSWHSPLQVLPVLKMREMITSQLLYLRGSSYETLFILLSSKNGKIVRILDLMRQSE
nr:hypothetical protein [Tanacetum cinerariifolium]